MKENADDSVERKQLEDALRESEERFHALADVAPVMIWMSGIDKLYDYFNKGWLDFTGRTIEQELGNGWLDGLYPDDHQHYLETYNTAFDKRQPFSIEYRLRRFDGEYRWVIDAGAPRWTSGGGFLGYIGSCMDITESKRAVEGQRFLAEAGTLLSASLDYETRLQSVARLAVPWFADWCAVDAIGADETIQRLAVAHVDPAKVAWAYELQRRYPADPNAPRGLVNVLRTGRSELFPEITDAMLVAGARDAEHLRIMREIGFTSAMLVPLVARGRTLGAISFVSAELGRHYGADDLALAEELARRAALSIDNARLYREARAQREWLRGTLSSIGDAVIATDIQGTVAFMNPVAEALTGYPQAEAAGYPLEQIFQIVNETTRAPVESPVGRVLREGVVVGLANHTLLLARNGAEIPIDDSGAPIRDDNGTISGVVLVFRDITERKRAEQVQMQLAAIVESSDDAIISKTLDGLILNWNAGAEGIYGYTAEEMLGQPIALIFPADRLDELRQVLERLKRGEHIDHYETERVRKDGARIHISLAISPIRDAAGKIIAASTIARDITERKRAENAQHFLAEASDLLAASLDYETTLERVARLTVPALADWCAVHILEEDGTIHRLSVAHVDPDKEAFVRARPGRYPLDPNAQYIVPQVLRTGRSEIYSQVPDSLLVAAARDSDHLTTLRLLGFKSYICVPLLAHGHALGAITLVAAESGRYYDANDLALAEELARRAAAAIENARLYREAQEAVRAREVFLSVASHELKTPLTTLLGNAQLFQRRAIREGSLNERDQRSLRLIVEQGSRLNRMIEALLDLTRIETGQLSIERAPVDLGVLARRMVDEALPGVDQHTIEYRPPDGPLIVVGDELRLEQVIQNLIQNAIKYCPSGGRITVQVTRNESIACVSVTDQGIGIPQAAQARLFSRFYRASNVNPQNISGMGIGLYVVKEIVNLHGGTVRVTSQEGQGSTFTICLPLNATTDGDDKRQETGDRGQGTGDRGQETTDNR